jgi:lysophospholipase L1-like esterase
MNARQSWFERNPRKTLLCLVAVCLVLAAAAVELWLERGLAPERVVRHIRLKERSPGLNLDNHARREAIERQFGLIVDGLEEKRYPLRTDVDGYIMPSRVHEQPQLTLAFLGGSTTECAWVDEESRFAYRSSVLLGRRLDRRINSYNGGASGANTLHLIDVLLNKVAALDPDAVLLMENINDVNIMLFAGSYWNDHRSRSLIVVEERPGRWQQLSLAVGGLIPGIADRLERAGWFARSADEFEGQRSVTRVRDDVDEADYEANLASFVEICRARGTQPILMTQFNRLAAVPDDSTRENMRRFEQDWGMDYATYKGLIDRFNEAVRRVARNKGADLIDLEARVPKESRYMYDIVHLNTAGSELVSEIIASELAVNAELRRRAGLAPGTGAAAHSG